MRPLLFFMARSHGGEGGSPSGLSDLAIATTRGWMTCGRAFGRSA